MSLFKSLFEKDFWKCAEGSFWEGCVCLFGFFFKGIFLKTYRIIHEDIKQDCKCVSVLNKQHRIGFLDAFSHFTLKVYFKCIFYIIRNLRYFYIFGFEGTWNNLVTQLLELNWTKLPERQSWKPINFEVSKVL